jgi:CBS domain containing-hemolysin-like protein
MVTSIFGIVTILVALVASALQRFYSAVPAKEVKRLAARGDQLAKVLYRPVSYGEGLRVLLWIVTVVLLPVGFGLLAQHTALPALVAVMVVVLAMALIWVPSLYLTMRTARLASWCAPLLDKILQYVHGPLQTVARLVNRHRTLHAHTGLFEKEDFAALLEQQREQPDNRMSEHHLELMHRALLFEDKKATDILLPRAETRMLDAKETLGPILLDELHKSGQSIFLVYQGSPETVVGTLPMKVAADAKQGGRISDLMRTELCYVNEDFALPHVAEALMRTKQYVAIVVNAFAEAVGVITLEQLMQEAFGELPESDVSYEDREAVASYKPKPVEEMPAEKADDAEASSAEAESTETATQPEANKQASSPETPEVVE